VSDLKKYAWLLRLIIVVLQTVVKFVEGDESP